MKKFLFDFFPIILFFAAYKIAGSYPQTTTELAAGVGYSASAKQLPILFATAIAILASFLQIGWLALRRHTIDKMLWVSLGIIVVFGGLTLALHDETFIKWKPTVLYWIFALVLLAAQLMMGKNLIRAMMEKQVSLPEPAWRNLLWSWIGFFALMGVLNLLVAFRFSEEAWVNFKLFGVLGLMLVFVFAQSLMLAKYVDKEKR